MTHRSEEESFKAVLLLNCQPPVFTPLGQPSTENKKFGRKKKNKAGLRIESKNPITIINFDQRNFNQSSTAFGQW